MGHRREKMKIKSFVLLTTLLTFSGCISITKDIPAYSTYTLNTPDAFEKNTPLSSKVKIEIKEPKALSSINSKYILYATKSFKSEQYALSKWSDRPSKMLQNQMIRYLSSTNNYTYINSSSINIQTDYQLLSELDSFIQYFEDEHSFVTFSIRVYLKNRKETHYKKFQYTQPCDENNAQGAVKAFNSIVEHFTKDLDRWILENIEQ